ncbi:MAG: hypothetical protein K2P09_03000 [Erysipelotrichales bacterium]|mgnify:FL=1|nr:hypothetical protein [Erysipelotrichales bacterium]
MLKTVIENNEKRAYFDFCTNKGYEVVIHALKRINYQGNDYYHVTASDVNLRFTKYTEEFKQIKDLVHPNTSLLDIFSACKILCKEEKDLLSYIDEKFKNDKIKNVSDIDFFGKLYYAEQLLKEHPVVTPDPHVISYEQIKIFNKRALFTPYRIDKSKLPKRIYVYETMADDNQNGEIVTIGKCIRINFWGTILATDKITLNNGYRYIDEKKNVDFLMKPSITLKEYLEKNPLNKKRENSR